MQKSNSSAETAADSSTQPNVNSSSPAAAKPHVASSFLSGIKNGSTYAGFKLISQIEDENSCHSHWLLLSLNKLIIERPELSVKEFINEVAEVCPLAAASVRQRLIDHCS